SAGPQEDALAGEGRRDIDALAIPGQALVIAQALVAPGQAAGFDALPVSASEVGAEQADRFAQALGVDLEIPFIVRGGDEFVSVGDALVAAFGGGAEKAVHVI